jgi:hypothetical protein
MKVNLFTLMGYGEKSFLRMPPENIEESSEKLPLPLL